MEGLEFHVEKANGEVEIFDSCKEAAQLAVAVSLGTGEARFIDVVAWSEKAAEFWGHGEEYREDPDCSVLERIEVRANSLGRIA